MKRTKPVMRTRRKADTTIDYGMRAKWIAGCRGFTGQKRHRQSMYKVRGQSIFTHAVAMKELKERQIRRQWNR